VKELSGNEEDHIQVIQNCKIAIRPERRRLFSPGVLNQLKYRLRCNVLR